MKKVIFIVFWMLMLFACKEKAEEIPSEPVEQVEDTSAEIREYLIRKGFNGFTFFEDNTYKYHTRTFGGDLDASGKYSIQDDILFLETCDTEERPIYETPYYTEMEIPGKYKVDLNKTELNHKGALINISTGDICWSYEYPASYEKIDIDGIECIRYPWGDENVPSEYILILENLKLRKTPSVTSDVVSVNGLSESGIGYYYDVRTIALAGQVCTIRAKTINEDTIDGITAPWYLIYAYGNDMWGMDTDVVKAWVFGGYVKEIKASEREDTEREYRPLLEQSIINLGGKLYSDEE